MELEVIKTKKLSIGFLVVLIAIGAYALIPGRVVKGNNNVLREIDSLFKKLASSDGAEAEWLDIEIGTYIGTHPREFLLALINNPRTRLEGLVGNLGPDYVDDFAAQIPVLEARYTAILSVTGVPEYAKNVVLCELSSQIHDERLSVLVSNKDKPLAKDYLANH